MTTRRALYELWAGESELEVQLADSLDPRGPDWLFELFASLGPKPGQMLVDVGARDGRHLTRLVDAHGVRGVAIDPVPQSPEVAEGSIESLPVADASVDWIWCRDVLAHVDVERGLAECARALRPGGMLLAYVTVADSTLEPGEHEWLLRSLALITLDRARIERAAAAAGLECPLKIEVGSEWRERMLEDGDWDANDALLRIARLRRSDASGWEADAYAADQLWGVYQLIGKLRPTVYVWERHG